MAKIKVYAKQEIYDGMCVTFRAPCDCTEVDGLKVCFGADTQTFAFRDAHENTLTGMGNLFTEGAYVKAILNTSNGYAYLQNADTNGYIEQRFEETEKLLSGEWNNNASTTVTENGIYDVLIYCANNKPLHACVTVVAGYEGGAGGINLTPFALTGTDGKQQLGWLYLYVNGSKFVTMTWSWDHTTFLTNISVSAIYWRKVGDLPA